MIMKHTHLLFAAALSLGCLASCSQQEQATDWRLWYEQPADEWMKALPVGNGRLGAMVYGGAPVETIALNEITFWTGYYDAQQDPVGGAEHQAEMRRLFFAGDYDRMHEVASKYMTGRAAKFGSHVPVGDMKIAFLHSDSVTGFSRELDLADAIASVSYRVNDTLYERELFCSHPADVMVMKITSDKRAAVGFDLSFDFNKSAKIKVEGNKIVFSGNTDVQSDAKSGVAFCGMARIELKGGSCAAYGDGIAVRDADEAVIYYDLNTDFCNENPASVTQQHIDAAVSMPYDELRAAHVADFGALFSRVSLDLGKGSASSLPTDVRQQRLAEGADDAGLAALFMQYGRYILISGSRENSPLPLNLQGNWNDNLACNMGWNCDYHLDINTQQNYWNANVCNLAECNAPLFKYIEMLVPYGRETVRTVYGTRGWTAHTTANCWGHTSPSGSIYWGAFPTGGTWLALQMAEHFAFTRDTVFLREEAYPVLKENALFLLDYLTEDPHTGYLLTGPSISPENGFGYNGKGYCLSMMPTVDRVLAYELFTNLIDYCEILQIDADFCDTLQAAVGKLPPLKIGAKGQLQEWYYDYDEIYPNHRHTSHLLGLFPYYQVNTPELEAACRVTIENRLNAPGWEDVEWSRANSICYYARLGDAGEAYRCLKTLITDLSRENLFTMSPKGIAGAPWDIFAVDGNTAGSAAVAEMLLQSHKGYIEFLPALPAEWNNGSFSGLCVRGGAEAAARWRDGLLQGARLTATASNLFSIKIPDAAHDLSFYVNGVKQELLPDSDGLVVLPLQKGDMFEMK